MRHALVVLLLLSGPTLAFELDDLQDRLNQTETLEGRFEQQRYLADLDTRLKSTGHFLYERDARMVWVLETPIEDRLVFTAENAADSLDEKAGAGSDRQRQQVGTLLLQLLQGDWHALQERFTLDVSGTNEAWQVTLEPKAKALRQRFTRIELKGADYLDNIALYAANEDVLRVRFFDQRPFDPSAAEAGNDPER
ncbi:outer membrane lipoprotein carrier protein LolA [Halomonas sp. PR-M31]|uniref:LolA family protein n=1 Tax=Halomonas sp. PR-M31 TaxID=1471202 RepID=UPI000651A5BC|nr:outer membrane lipoprotein carrier protein LolA [Halomonas sp. PR-M31]